MEPRCPRRGSSLQRSGSSPNPALSNHPDLSVDWYQNSPSGRLQRCSPPHDGCPKSMPVFAPISTTDRRLRPLLAPYIEQPVDNNFKRWARAAILRPTDLGCDLATKVSFPSVTHVANFSHKILHINILDLRGPKGMGQNATSSRIALRFQPSTRMGIATCLFSYILINNYLNTYQARRRTLCI
jgi:hypothetical protein